jgi:hypothetical protein
VGRIKINLEGGERYVSLAYDEKDVKNNLNAVENALRCL